RPARRASGSRARNVVDAWKRELDRSQSDRRWMSQRRSRRSEREEEEHEELAWLDLPDAGLGFVHRVLELNVGVPRHLDDGADEELGAIPRSREHGHGSDLRVQLSVANDRL